MGFKAKRKKGSHSRDGEIKVLSLTPRGRGGGDA